jgi:hypothetical protein
LGVGHEAETTHRKNCYETQKGDQDSYRVVEPMMMMMMMNEHLCDSNSEALKLRQLSDNKTWALPYILQ